MSFHTAIAAGLVVYACLMAAVSLYWTARVHKTADYLVASRGLPYWVLTGTIFATCIGTGVVIGASGLAYQHGWAGCAYPIGLGLGTLLAGLIFGAMRRYRFMTLAEEIACAYNGNRVVVEFSSISLFFSQVCWTTVQIMGAGAVLGVVTGWRPDICLVLAGLITAMISVPGGLKTVVYTDFVQAVILLCGFGFLTYHALSNAGGLAGLRQSVPSASFSFLGVSSYGTWKVVSLILALVLSVIADPGRRLSMYSARDVWAAKWSMATAGSIVIAFSAIVGIVGMYSYRLNPHLTSADQALPWLVTRVLPPWLAAVVVVSVSSAIFSSANGNAAAAGTFFVRHIFPLTMRRYPKAPLSVARSAMACMFVFSTALALYTGSIVGFVVKFLPVTMSGLAVVIVLGRFWRGATWQGALAALVVTPVVSLAVTFLPGQAAFWENPAIPATLAGLAAHLFISKLTPQSPRSFEEIAALLSREREAIEGGAPSGAVPPEVAGKFDEALRRGSSP